MSDYTLTTADIEAEYGRVGNGPERRAEFQAWLAEHDREVRAEAWDEGHATPHELEPFDGHTFTAVNPYRETEQ